MQRNKKQEIIINTSTKQKILRYNLIMFILIIYSIIIGCIKSIKIFLSAIKFDNLIYKIIKKNIMVEKEK